VIRTIAELFYEALEHNLPDAMAFKAGSGYRPLSHPEIRAQVERLVLALRQQGIGAGDRVAILSENRPEWAMTDYACAILGVVSVPVYPTLNPNQTAYVIRHSGARAIFCSSQMQLAKVLHEWHQTPELELAVLMEGAAPASPHGHRLLDWNQLQAAGRAQEDQRDQVRVWAGERDPGDLLTLIYTSGTTGEPKGAILTHGNLVSNILAALKVLQVSAGWSCLSILPLSHIFERMGGHYTMFFAGVRIYYLDDLANIVPAFQEVQPEVLLAVPRVYEKVYARIREAVNEAGFAKRWVFHWAMAIGRKMAACRYVERQPGPLLGFLYGLADKAVFAKVRARMGGRLRMTASGGAALGPILMEFFWAAGIPVFEGYGLSETSPILTLSIRGEVRPGYVGRPLLDQWQGLPFVKLSEDGEILCQGPNVTLGYWNDPFATREAFDATGYFRTGDIGAFDEQGRLRITDRKKEILVTSAGKNVAPQPIERMLAADKYISQAVLIGDHRNFVSAVIVANLASLHHWAARAGISFKTDAELVARPEAVAKVMERIGRINEQLSNYERIRKIILVHEEMTLDNGMLTPSLKVKRRAVNEKYGVQIEDLYGGPVVK
jgi:long-chain acyl-CoA synthetase